jgi:hypothetical protein
MATKIAFQGAGLDYTIIPFLCGILFLPLFEEEFAYSTGPLERHTGCQARGHHYTRFSVILWPVL